MLKKRNRQPYSEIIDLQSELKEYRKLCRGTSKKFIYYLDWKSHILGEISKLNTPDKLINFKHYLLNENRVNKNINSYFVTLVIFYLTTCINKLNMNYSGWLFVILILAWIVQILKLSDEYNKEYCFYCDLIEIIEEIEKNTEEKEGV